MAANRINRFIPFLLGVLANGQSLFYPITPCRVADTRFASYGPLGPPALTAGQSRAFPIPSGACGVPAGALAYFLNVTVVPRGPLGYITAYPTGQPVPLVATLNDDAGEIRGNAAIVAAGTGGAISIYTTDATDVVIDLYGWFMAAPPPVQIDLYSGDGTTSIFALTRPPSAGSIPVVHRNGLLQDDHQQGTVLADYTMTGNAIVFSVAPGAGDKIRIVYR